ncbi:MAG: glycosyltransferase [Rhizobiaceae bacterium]|nr:glycosyltransferase [Rhizobiaceae bacterium]
MPDTVTPRVSIVTPVWNAASYITETVISVVSQLESTDEYIVIDDGSTDGTTALLEDLSRAHGFQVIRQERRGEIAAVNAGVAATSNSLVCVVNADDPVLAGLVRRMKRAFQERPELVGAYPDWRMIDASGGSIRTVRTASYSYQAMLAEHFCIPGPGAFFRKDAVAGEPWRDPRAEGLSDFDFWLRLGLNGAPVQRIPEVLATWRSHASGTTATIDGSKLANAKIELVRRIFARSDLPTDVQAMRGQALSAAYYQAALLGLRHSGVPSLRYAAASYWHLPVWPKLAHQTQRRSMTHLGYALLQPVSGWCHRLIDPLLPPRYRRSRVLAQTFGLE